SIVQKIFRTLPVKMDIVTRTSWKEEHLDNSITGTYDFLNRIFVKTIALREFLEDWGHRPLSISKVLDKMANFGLIIRVMIDAIYVEQSCAYNDPKNVLECRYGIGVEETQKSKQFVDLTEKGYTDHTAGSPAVKVGSLNRLYSPIKSVENTFEHRSEGTTLEIPSKVGWDQNLPKSFSGKINNTGNIKINVNIEARAEAISPTAPDPGSLSGGLTIRVGNLEWREEGVSGWSNSPETIN